MESATGRIGSLSAELDRLRLRSQLLSLLELLERKNFLLERLSVASARLLQALENGDVCDAVAEIIATLIGSEEIAIFDYCPERKTFKLVRSWGVAQDTLEFVARGGGMLGRAVQQRTSEFRAPRDSSSVDRNQTSLPDDPRLNACILLKSGEEVAGAITIFRLLPQKLQLEWTDFELLKFLEVYGAAAIFIERLQKELVT